MLRYFLALPLLLLAGCGESPTGGAAAPPDVPWTASLELAAGSLSDPVMVETLEALSGSPTGDVVRALVGEADRLAAARRVQASAGQVAAALDRLAAYSDEEGAVEAAVLRLLLQDVEERFRVALAPTHGTH